MSDDTRDIAIRLEAEVRHQAETIAEMRKELGLLRDDMQQRRGVERLAQMLIGLGSGATTLAALKVSNWLGWFPLR